MPIKAREAGSRLEITDDRHLGGKGLYGQNQIVSDNPDYPWFQNIARQSLECIQIEPLEIILRKGSIVTR